MPNKGGIFYFRANQGYVCKKFADGLAECKLRLISPRLLTPYWLLHQHALSMSREVRRKIPKYVSVDSFSIAALVIM